LPNDRSLHAAPVPRVGGLALWAGFAPVAAWSAPDLPGGIAGWLPAWLAIAAISLADDANGVPVLARLFVQAAWAPGRAGWPLGGSGWARAGAGRGGRAFPSRSGCSRRPGCGG